MPTKIWKIQDNITKQHTTTKRQGEGKQIKEEGKGGRRKKEEAGRIMTEEEVVILVILGR